MDNEIIILAGSTGTLGRHIAGELLERGVGLRALVRHSSAADKVEELRKRGAEIAEVDFNSVSDVTEACLGGGCVISALAGLRETIVDTQTVLLDAAVKSGVRRFIPSDFSIDFTKLHPGTNRNFDLRREFHERLDRSAIAATSIFNGMFMNLLTGRAPIVLFKFKRILYWEDADQPLDFTTIDDVAKFTAAAALDADAPRYLHIAGDRLSARGLVEVVGEMTGEKFRLFRAGGLRWLERLIMITRAIVPGSNAVYPPWQGMQYVHNMFSGHAGTEPLDNDRYPDMQWTTVGDFLAAR